MRRLVKRVGGKRASVPHGELVRFARDVGERVAVDFAAGREIGLSVVVLSPVHRAPLLERLSPRERTVARLITEGRRNESIAAELNIAVSTVKDHVHHILSKTGLSSRTELAAVLARSGF